MFQIKSEMVIVPTLTRVENQTKFGTIKYWNNEQRYIPIKLHTLKTTPYKTTPIPLKGAGIENS